MSWTNEQAKETLRECAKELHTAADAFTEFEDSYTTRQVAPIIDHVVGELQTFTTAARLAGRGGMPEPRAPGQMEQHSGHTNYAESGGTRSGSTSGSTRPGGSSGPGSTR